MKALDFSGRATRAEYWWWVLFVDAVLVALIAIGYICAMANENLIWIGIIPMVTFYFSVLIPSLSLFFRRMHDFKCSTEDALLLLLIIPSGKFVILTYLFGESDNDNEYGPKPIY